MNEWMDVGREGGMEWMKGERKEGRERLIDGWMGYKVLQQIETRVLYQCPSSTNTNSN
jgi:hypothetical protein